MNDKTIQVNQVFKTDDYSIFKVIDGNRPINKANVSRLVKSMENELLQVPIIINEKYEIIDGQHRFAACQETKNPIYFIIVRGYTLSQVHRLNAISRKWSFDDYLNAYADMGIKDYEVARDFIERYGFSGQASLAMLLNYNGSSGGEQMLNFFNCKFKVKDIKKAEETAENLIYTGIYYKGYKRRSFTYAMMYLFSHKNFDFNVFISKLEKNQTKLVDCTNRAEYIKLIEEIYNYRSRQKVRFY